jgi:hypothetical protein
MGRSCEVFKDRCGRSAKIELPELMSVKDAIRKHARYSARRFDIERLCGHAYPQHPRKQPGWSTDLCLR